MDPNLLVSTLNSIVSKMELRTDGLPPYGRKQMAKSNDKINLFWND